jgi:hypothetical protein
MLACLALALLSSARPGDWGGGGGHGDFVEKSTHLKLLRQAKFVAFVLCCIGQSGLTLL